jgi:hypothetical protein
MANGPVMATQLENSRCVYLTVGAEENGGSEGSLEGTYEPSVLCSALPDPESVQHRGGRGKRDCRRLLASG